MIKALSALLDIDGARLRVTGRTAAASCLALGVGTLIGLDHPQWAAMTVWITALPTRGQRLERSLARIAGTILGALAGVALMVLSGNHPAAIVIGLTFWLGLCAGTGNILSGALAYISLLAGYSAAMVALLGYGHDMSLWMLAIDRVATVCLGGAVGTVVALIFSPRPQPIDYSQRISCILHACLDHIGKGGVDKPERARLFSEIAALDENLDIASAGSIRIRHQARDIRSLLAALTELLLETLPERDCTIARIEQKDNDDLSIRLEDMADDLASFAPRQAALLRMLVPLWRRADRTAATIGSAQDRPMSPRLHRDWIGARHAALRSAGAVATTGLLWLATGWQFGPFMIMGAAIMTSVFSTFPNPGLQMRWVVGGSLGGAFAAIIAHMLILPMADGPGMAALLIMPLVLLGMFVMAHRRIGMAGMEYNLIYLLIMNPNMPTDPALDHVLLQALAVFLGPVSTYLAFLAIPVDTRRRLGFVIRLMVHELVAMAKGAFDAPDRHEHWRLRIYHRLMMLVRWSERSGHGSDFAANGGMSVVRLANSLREIRQMIAENAADAGSQRALRAALLSIAHLSHNPTRVVGALNRASRKLQAQRQQDAARLGETAALLAANQDFFRRAG